MSEFSKIIDGDFGDISPDFTNKFESIDFKTINDSELEDLKNYILSQKDDVIIYFIVNLLDTCEFLGLNNLQFENSVRNILTDKRFSEYMDIIRKEVIISDPNREIIINFIKKHKSDDGWCELAKIGNYLKNMKVKLSVSLTEYLENSFFKNELEIHIDKDSGIRRCKLL